MSSFCSWSGGKDSALAVWRFIQENEKPEFALTMFNPEGGFSKSHHIPETVIEAQSAGMGMLPVWGYAGWGDYEEEFRKCLRLMRDRGVTDGVFGDIDIEEHRQWVERVCRAEGMTAHLPLWKVPRMELVKEFLASGFEALVIAVKDGVLGPEYLGRQFSDRLVDEFIRMGVDACGEKGEFHTIVTNCPIFDTALKLDPGRPKLHDGYWFLAVNNGGI